MIERQNGTQEWTLALKEIARAMGERAVLMATSDVTVEYKADSSPVTAIDQELNRMLIDLSREAFPGVAVWAEEGSTAPYGDTSAIEGRSLVIGDPIDGTEKLVRALRSGDIQNCRSTILLAVFAPDKAIPEAAVVHSPFLAGQPMFWADQTGSYVSTKEGKARKLQVADDGPTDLDQVRTYKNSDWDGCVPGPADTKMMLPNAREGKGFRLTSVADGTVDLSIFPGPRSNLHDVIPPLFVARQAGAATMALDGRSFEELMTGDPIPGVLAAVNQQLAERVLGYLAIR